jgi:hypothetical protein
VRLRSDCPFKDGDDVLVMLYTLETPGPKGVRVLSPPSVNNSKDMGALAGKSARQSGSNEIMGTFF